VITRWPFAPLSLMPVVVGCSAVPVRLAIIWRPDAFVSSDRNSPEPCSPAPSLTRMILQQNDTV